jgi:hypothetical protein
MVLLSTYTVARGQGRLKNNSKNKTEILRELFFQIFFCMVKKRILKNIP